MTDDKNIEIVDNYINGKFVPPKSSSKEEYIDILNPSNNEKIGKVALSDEQDVNDAVIAAKDVFEYWSKKLTMKSRAALMLNLHALIKKHSQEIANIIVKENGKNITEALADVAKGNETIEYACSLPQLCQGKILKVSSEVTCQDRLDPIGIVSCIVPFNFPFMVPMWTTPIALVTGNCVILKPSEKVPLTMKYVAKLFEEAGFPPGVFQMIQGTKNAVTSLINNPSINGITFVGSSKVAKIVTEQCYSLHKRVIALGGAKNHLIAATNTIDNDAFESASSDITVSYAGCSGQRCMAASVLLLVGSQGNNDKLLEKIIEKSKTIEPGTESKQMGPVIDSVSYNKIMSYLDECDKSSKSKIILDGRSWNKLNDKDGGNWIGPTIVEFTDPTEKTICEEVFGPVLSVYRCTNGGIDEAIKIENNNPYGNASSIYTSDGSLVEYFTSRVNASMLGVNIGIPVPREPFSFGGLYGTKSKYGSTCCDITSEGGIEFFTNRIKITSKFPKIDFNKINGTNDDDNVIMNGTSNHDTKRKREEAEVVDHANFAGSM